MPPTATSTKETTNYARLCRLLVDVGTQALRDTLDVIHTPANLHLVLVAKKTTLQSLRSRKIINPTQWGKLFPAIPSSVSLASFDITLTTVLLRNICGLLPPATGWDKLPVATDVSREADIARIKYFRNTVYAHAEHASIDNAAFNSYWQEIRDAMVRLGGVQYRPAIDHLETECMDPESEDHYKEVLSQWKKDEDNVKDQLNDIESEIKNIGKKLDELTASNLITTKKDTCVEEKSLELGEMSETTAICAEIHINEPLDCYCQNCKVCICNKCGEMCHAYHTKMDIKQAAEVQKLKIVEVVEQLKNEIEGHEMQMVKTTEMLKESKEKVVEARNNIRTAMKELMQVFKEDEMAMLTELDVIEEEEERGHAAQLELSQMFVEQLKNSVEECEAILQRNVSIEILQAQQVAIIQRCKSHLIAKKMDIYKPLHVRYERNEDYFQNGSRGTIVGRVVATYTDPLQSVAQGDGLKEAEVGREAKFTIITQDSERKQCYNGDDQLTMKVQAFSGQVLDTKVEHMAGNVGGEYTVTYMPDCAERHDVMIAVNGQPLTGSPWSIQASPHQYKSVFWFGSLGQQPGQFCMPGGISINDNTGNIAIADYGNNRIQLFSPDGSFLRAFGQGSGAERLFEPISVAFNRSNEVIIIDSRKMVSFTESGHFIKNISNKRLYKPRDLTVMDDGRMVVCDTCDNAVKVLSPDGSEILQLFSAPERDVPPWSALYHQDKFFVCYGAAHCIKVFNKEGIFLFNIGSEGSGEAQLFYPIGHTIDKFNNLIVCDSRNRRLQVFKLDGTFLHTLCGELTGFEVPWSVAVSSNGQLLVTNAQKNCVHVLH